MLAIIDYGMGNLRSVQKGFERVGVAATITADPAEIARADKLVLPGVGAFPDAMAELQRRGLIEPIRQAVRADKPFLGICLGLQLLFETGDEGGRHEGLGLLAGEVVRFPPQTGLKVPHMGWNQLELRGNSPLFAEVPNGSHVYFVHSYYVVPRDSQVIAAQADYGHPFTAAIQHGQLMATQFHPEKSQDIGLKMLANFART